MGLLPTGTHQQHPLGGFYQASYSIHIVEQFSCKFCEIFGMKIVLKLSTTSKVLRNFAKLLTSTVVKSASPHRSNLKVTTGGL